MPTDHTQRPVPDARRPASAPHGAGMTRWVGRQYRTLVPRRGSLVRGTDRVEAATHLVVVVLLIVSVPLLVGLGLAVDRHLVADAARQRAAGHSVTAVLLQDTQPVAVDGAGEMASVPIQARARWQVPGGGTREGLVPAPRGLSPGTQVDTWLDARGWPAPRPMPEGRAAAIGVLVATGGWVAAAGLLGALVLGVRLGLDRRRYRAWAREWAAIAPRRPGRGPSPGP